ncbi:MAG: hypothetical protein COY39_04235 [Alphaproteobacteria bacterium CG_4_10_14_0_8_um_filter_37_21]|nr:MAG: hypothetical protein COY39_04235 [Alphaproteobacteria bacterium CG_4_10_14_0_8_um_filter_37_21]
MTVNKKKSKKNNWFKKNKKIFMYAGAFIALNLIFYIGDIITFVEERIKIQKEENLKQLKDAADSALAFKNAKVAFILKASSVIRRGEVLVNSQIEKVEIPKEEYKDTYHLAENVLNDLPQYVAARHMEPGDILHEINFIKKNKLFVQKLLKPNFRSIYLNVTPKQIVNPSIYPGMRVDVAISKKTNLGTKTERVMCGVKILDMTESQNSDDEPVVKKPSDVESAADSFIVFEIEKDEAENFLSISQQYELIFLPISSAESIADRELVCSKEEKYGIKVFRGL